MAVDEQLSDRVRRHIGKRKGLSEKRMFGCLAFFVNGNLACGVRESELIVRLAPGDYAQALKERGARRFDLSGRPTKGWLLVEAADDEALSSWIRRGMSYAASLPPQGGSAARGA